jgi:hypothetical protein
MRLLDQVRDVIWKKDYSIRAEQSYINCETVYPISQKMSSKRYVKVRGHQACLWLALYLKTFILFRTCIFLLPC